MSLLDLRYMWYLCIITSHKLFKRWVQTFFGTRCWHVSICILKNLCGIPWCNLLSQATYETATILSQTFPTLRLWLVQWYRDAILREFTLYLAELRAVSLPGQILELTRVAGGQNCIDSPFIWQIFVFLGFHNRFKAFE